MADMVALANIDESLINNIKENHKWKTYYMPEYINYTVPTSEKTFIWNAPMGTEIDLPEDDLVIGIYRRGADGAEDFDLSYIDINGWKVWRNGWYNTNGVIYSWDMTSARPDATELLYFTKKAPDWMIKINRYFWERWSKYTLFVAKEDKANIKKWHMVKKENIIFQTQIESTDRESIVGIKTWDKLILQNMISSNKAVSNNSTVTDAYINIVVNNNSMMLRWLLDAAGLKFMEPTSENPVDIDLSDPKKDDIINIIR